MQQTSAFFAGFFDADGSIQIAKSKDSFNLHVRINQTSRPILDMYKEKYGGKVQGPYDRHANDKPQWFWACDAQKAEDFIVDVLPFLVVKQERGQLALEFRKLFKGDNILPRGPQAVRYTNRRDEILAQRSAFYDQMRVLNKRGKT